MMILYIGERSGARCALWLWREVERIGDAVEDGSWMKERDVGGHKAVAVWVSDLAG